MWLAAASGSLTAGMRAVVTVLSLAVLAGCGGAAPVAKTPAKVPKAPEARDVVYLYRVQGDDPLPDSIRLRADGNAEVIRGGGHGGSTTLEVALPHAVAARAIQLARTAPWKALDGSTVTPGGFGGWDNDMRYMLRRGERSITVSDAHMPRSVRPLIAALDAIIEGEQGRVLSSDRHSGGFYTPTP